MDFFLYVANYGTQQCRCEVTACVGEETVECQPPQLDLIPNVPPAQVRVFVPRPRLGDLVHEFNNETTLYDKTLRVEASAGKRKESSEWHELVYTPEANSQRHAIQQEIWQKGLDRG